MIVCHSRKFLFISNPKTGSTSIEFALAACNDEPQLNEIFENGLYTQNHMPAQFLKNMLSADIWNDYFKFSFVRNPWDWFVSQHFYNLDKNGVAMDINARLRKRDILETYEFLKMYRGNRNAESAFQHSFLCNNKNEVLVDFVGRFERFRDDFQEIQNRIHTNSVLPHLNSSKHKDYRFYFNDESRSIIAELYKVDIELFGYDFY
ncbi:MAG TPA: sulfotransferase family 2 domain-containing protein [Anaerolineales bacterium]|nr:sulfotransferase family 2 domain-containing protein [Anaerolineales bacterium]